MIDYSQEDATLAIAIFMQAHSTSGSAEPKRKLVPSFFVIRTAPEPAALYSMPSRVKRMLLPSNQA
ncbi:MAG: hypothetical protein HY253_06465, partial [Burkholderiales bacterium]|nr:hypothetical protein [Burkholderiales bacterium]